MNNFKKSYVAKRRSVKKRILRRKEEAEIYASSETAREETADDLEEGNISNIFEKLFEQKPVLLVIICIECVLIIGLP